MRDLPFHTGIRLPRPRLTRSAGPPRGRVRLVRGDRDVFGLRGRSAEQRVALDLLLDPSIGILSLGGRAGTGKSALALCAGLEAVLERAAAPQGHGVPAAVRGRRPGVWATCPAARAKDGPVGQGRVRHLGALASAEVLEEVVERGILEVLPLTHIRGRSLHDSFVIVDEAQSLERNVLADGARTGSGRLRSC